MKIVNNYPPNIDAIRKVVTPKPGTVFTYGDTVYSPHANYLDDHLREHEQVHIMQQTETEGMTAELWWDKYLVDVNFRLEQEIEAYRAQFQYFRTKRKDREEQNRFLMAIASDLSSPMYGGIITFVQAMNRIRSK